MRAAPLFPGLNRSSLTKWLSDGVLQRLPPFLESLGQHFGPRILYVGPAHLSSTSTLLLTECQQLDPSGCCCRTNELKADGALGEDRYGSDVDGVPSLLHGSRRSRSHGFKGGGGHVMQGRHIKVFVCESSGGDGSSN